MGFFVSWGALFKMKPIRSANSIGQINSTGIVVLVLAIGTLVAGVLLTRVLLSKARIEQAVDLINNTTAAVFAYQDRYGRTPGDDGPAASLVVRSGGWSSVTAGNVNGVLDVGINQVFTGDQESGPFWQQLRAAGFFAGDSADSGRAALPKNPFGGLTSVLSEEVGGGLDGNKVCLSQVPGAAASAIDQRLDDGDGASGRLRGTLGTAGANTNPSNSVLSQPYQDGSPYTICYRM